MKHIHAEVMHHYAEGGEIEVKISENHGWTQCTRPLFDPKHQYRIKPGSKNLNNHKTVDLYELESDMLDCWNITSDLLLPIENEILSSYYSAKFEKLWNTYSKLVKDLYE